MTQTAAIRAALEAGEELTPLDALSRFGTFRLAARIEELRREGVPVETIVEQRGGKRYARYRLAGPKQREIFA